MPERLRGMAYKDGPLPIGEGQTNSQPLVVANGRDWATGHVLDGGNGLGYAAAVASCLAAHVYKSSGARP